eukprot:TRINITY_DN20013_c0_g1_i1.p5 TRINITY_DN20013_c0_g1~~TRINITY_DN20013_c0_g1_i1.p5  ORF type:complete len:144 (-),score=24.35 TRINITY_DN20013_c0_g1_i1:481-912(-)
MSFIKYIFSGEFYDATNLSKSPSFNDFSLHVGSQATSAESEFMPDTKQEKTEAGSPKSEEEPKEEKAELEGGQMWRSRFVKPVGKHTTTQFDTHSEALLGKNTYMKQLGKNYYDTVSDVKKELSVWEEINRADTAEDAFKTSA